MAVNISILTSDWLLQYLLERLAAQKLQSNDLREFLRLGHPLASLSDDQVNYFWCLFSSKLLN